MCVCVCAVDDRANIGAAIGAAIGVNAGTDAGVLVRVLSMRHWCATRPATATGPCVLSTDHSCRCGLVDL